MNNTNFRYFGKMAQLDDAIREQDVRDYSTTFWVSEKIDGCNIGIHITPTQIFCYSRNGNDANDLFDFSSDRCAFEGLIISIQEFIRDNRAKGVESVYLWGEYYGNKINRRINYGVNSAFKFYDGYIIGFGFEGIEDTPSEIRLTPKMLNWFVSNLRGDVKKFFVNFKEYRADSLSDLKAMLPLPAKSEYCDDEMEGYVITEITEDYKVVHYKYKSEKFQNKPPKVKFAEESELNKKVVSLNEIFKKYVNDARVIEVFSKNTDLSNKNMSCLCRQLIDDAKEDFNADYADSLKELDADESKRVYNIGSLPYLMIKRGLENVRR